MDIEEEGEVVVGVWVLLVDADALFEMLDCVLVVSYFEICEA